MVTLYYGFFADGKAGSRVLLDRACKDLMIPCKLTHDGLGKPVLPDGPEISISHTKGAAALALSDTPVGADLEMIRPVRPSLPRRIMSPAEYCWYQAEGETPEDFFALWTLKESYYKFLGTGLPGFPNGTEFCLEDGAWRLTGSPLRFEVYRENLLTVALCSADQEVRVIRWEES